jgi:hypothetical protein
LWKYAFILEQGAVVNSLLLTSTPPWDLEEMEGRYEDKE